MEIDPMWIINGLFFLLFLVVGFIVKDVISTQKNHSQQLVDIPKAIDKDIQKITSEVQENKASIKANSDMDRMNNSTLNKGIDDINKGISGLETRILAQLEKNEKLSAERLNIHDREIKRLNEKMVVIESKLK